MAVIRRGFSSPGLPFTWIVASSFRFGALDGAAERLVEQALDVLLVVPSPAGGQRQRGEEQEEHGAAHAPQSSWRHRNSVRLGALFRRMGYVKRTALAAAVMTAVAAAPAHAGTVIVVDGKTRPSA